MLIYKFVNTADSKIGYKNKRYRDFGWASARLDDLVNYIPARLTSFMYAMISRNTLKVLRITLEMHRNIVHPMRVGLKRVLLLQLELSYPGLVFMKALKQMTHG